MLQVFQMNVAKVDQDVAYVAMVMYVQMSVTNVSSMFSEHMLQVCLSGCCICFIHTLHMFYLDVVYGCNGFQVLDVFSSGLEACFKCFIYLQTYIATVVFVCYKSNRVLHLSSPSAASSRCVLLPVEPFWIGGATPFPSYRLGGAGLCGVRETEYSARALI
jgi:hypothetical protein